MPKCDFNKVSKQLQLWWNRTSAWVFSCKFAAYFQNTFSQEHIWIVSELFHFSNHSKLIAFHILILRGRRWFRWSESLFIIFSSSFLHGRWGLRSEYQPTKSRFLYCCITYFLSSNRSYVFYKRVILQNYCNIYRKTPVIEHFQ